MKIFLLTVMMALVACTKPNPNRCCTDEADCTTHNIPSGSTCGDGLLCRGNQCIAVTCSTAAECDLSAPYCVDASCTEACTADTQCAGFQQTANEKYCVSGACVECRINSPTDCSAATPVCDAGVCRVCRAHSECASGVCAADGMCADEAAIAYVDQAGSTTSDCTKAAPCNTIGRALSITPSRSYVVVKSGTYTSASTTTFTGTRWIIGSGATQPVITRSTAGPIISLTGSVDATFENLQLSGATNNSTENGNAIACNANAGTSSVTLRGVTVKQNAADGLVAGRCTVSAFRSAFSQNGGFGVSVGDGNATIDGCLISENANGLSLDAGLFKITNNLIVRNYSASRPVYGINMYSTAPGNQVEFNTIVDNTDGTGVITGSGLECNLPNTSQSFPNNIIARNNRQTYGATCTYPSSLIIDTDITPLKFASPDAQPFDYHIGAGSVAIDAATASTNDHDVDGQQRPSGGGRDVGADEYVP